MSEEIKPENKGILGTDFTNNSIKDLPLSPEEVEIFARNILKAAVGEEWLEFFIQEFKKTYFIEMTEKLKEERANYNIIPSAGDTFKIFRESTPDSLIFSLVPICLTRKINNSNNMEDVCYSYWQIFRDNLQLYLKNRNIK